MKFPAAAWAFFVCLSVVACDRTKHSVDYYYHDAEAREQKIAECRKNPVRLGADLDCINAGVAAGQVLKKGQPQS